MQLTTLISATLVACSGFAAAAPNAIPKTDLTLPTAIPALEISTEAVQDDGDVVDLDDESSIEKRGDWVRTVRFCEHANGGGACDTKDFRPSTGCYNVYGFLNNRVSSIYLAPGTGCTVYADGNCAGNWLKVFDPGYKNLKGQSSMNDRISSMRCSAR
ncbi:beta gamma crystallin protein [Diplodia corticola]|uniref:Beta gamma crystallin protein n=1 Tax=Diplodia corticola TaxID=236234 RepID=A0A1J9R2F2_9PEZI|nr:beta gamma crystallin protein [Diplodia corticola]OJD34761.1 beta gamma crystallin protein [Diplodia corticola]